MQQDSIPSTRVEIYFPTELTETLSVKFGCASVQQNNGTSCGVIYKHGHNEPDIRASLEHTAGSLGGSLDWSRNPDEGMKATFILDR